MTIFQDIVINNRNFLHKQNFATYTLFSEYTKLASGARKLSILTLYIENLLQLFKKNYFVESLLIIQDCIFIVIYILC